MGYRAGEVSMDGGFIGCVVNHRTLWHHWILSAV